MARHKKQRQHTRTQTTATAARSRNTAILSAHPRGSTHQMQARPGKPHEGICQKTRRNTTEENSTMGLTITQLEARRTPGKSILTRDAYPGLSVQVTDNSGLDSLKRGTIARSPLEKTAGWYSGRCPRWGCSNWQQGRGTYAHEVSVLLDDGTSIGMFTARLQYPTV